MRIVAIGGSASVGKTTGAVRVAGLLGLKNVVHVDDLAKQIQASGEPHVLDTINHPWRQSPSCIAHQLVRWTRRLHPAILEAAETLRATGGVIEGEGVDPRLAADGAWVGVSAVYVIEADPARLRETFQTRTSASRFAALPPDEQDAVVEMNRLYGEWLRTVAVEARQPWVPSRPWTTLAERIITAIG